jgi:phosphoenolpyruvate-protein kinase (PTS system EI component)
VHDLVEFFCSEQRLHAFAVCQVETRHREAVVAVEKLRAGVLQRHIVVIVEVVEPDDSVPALEQYLRGVVADKPGRAGHEYFQGVPL